MLQVSRSFLTNSKIYIRIVMWHKKTNLTSNIHNFTHLQSENADQMSQKSVARIFASLQFLFLHGCGKLLYGASAAEMPIKSRKHVLGVS